MTTQKTKSAFISAMVFIYVLSFLPSLKRFLSNCWSAFVCVAFYLVMVAIGLTACNLLLINIGSNWFFNLACYFIFALFFPAFGMFKLSNKIEKLINIF